MWPAWEAPLAFAPPGAPSAPVEALLEVLAETPLEVPAGGPLEVPAGAAAEWWPWRE